jgi:hypothetical protein
VALIAQLGCQVKSSQVKSSLGHKKQKKVRNDTKEKKKRIQDPPFKKEEVLKEE